MQGFELTVREIAGCNRELEFMQRCNDGIDRRVGRQQEEHRRAGTDPRSHTRAELVADPEFGERKAIGLAAASSQPCSKRQIEQQAEQHAPESLVQLRFSGYVYQPVHRRAALSRFPDEHAGISDIDLLAASQLPGFTQRVRRTAA